MEGGKCRAWPGRPIAATPTGTISGPAASGKVAGRERNNRNVKMFDFPTISFSGVSIVQLCASSGVSICGPQNELRLRARGPRMAPTTSIPRTASPVSCSARAQVSQPRAVRSGAAGHAPARVARGGQALNPSRYCLSRRRAMDALRLRTGSSGYHVGMPGRVWQRGRSSRWSGKTPRVPLVGCDECLNAIATTP